MRFRKKNRYSRCKGAVAIHTERGVRRGRTCEEIPWPKWYSPERERMQRQLEFDGCDRFDAYRKATIVHREFRRHINDLTPEALSAGVLLTVEFRSIGSHLTATFREFHPCRPADECKTHEFSVGLPPIENELLIIGALADRSIGTSSGRKPNKKAVFLDTFTERFRRTRERLQIKGERPFWMWILMLLILPEGLLGLLDELDNEFDAIAEADGHDAARNWYRLQALRGLWDIVLGFIMKPHVQAILLIMSFLIAVISLFR